MRRRRFIKTMAGASAFIGSMPAHGLGLSNYLTTLAAQGTKEDRILVVVFLSGGNDGLNTIVPMDQYAQYYNYRSNLALPEKKLWGLTSRTGLHPVMRDTKEMYDEGRVTIIQNVGYPDMSLSHFKGRDLWLTAGDPSNPTGSGWMGRYLNDAFPDYPLAYPTDQMPDPLAIEIGAQSSIGFSRNEGITTSIAFRTPDSFFDLVNKGTRSTLASNLDVNTNYGKSLTYLKQMNEKAHQYAARVKEVYDKGNNTIDYRLEFPGNAPIGVSKNNGLARQLQIIARLIAGGSKTRVFMVQLGGFDTHSQQVEIGATDTGRHAVLLSHLSTAMRDFFTDLRNLKQDDRVLGMTVSEFGRRVRSNGSYGSDHGTAAPMFIFGNGAEGGVIGDNANLNSLNRGGNLKVQYDYRQVYTSVLKDWFSVNDAQLEDHLLKKYDPITGANGQEQPIINQAFKGSATENLPKFYLYQNIPNPVTNFTTIRFYLVNDIAMRLSVIDRKGSLIQVLVDNKNHPKGNFRVQFDASRLVPGVYFYRIEAGGTVETKKMLVVK
ncbi:DUF1501 domain-containing protein [uncultured Microscilla sp.]|uniref:DUF1501 domain-containing protein n=1 Tax=uncultured Microscilla sp. TaxID=432653 RepID=UPI0026142FD6|nr:DUF1501 domain-containing protein [uncultured Microscilla sp.]